MFIVDYIKLAWYGEPQVIKNTQNTQRTLEAVTGERRWIDNDNNRSEDQSLFERYVIECKDVILILLNFISNLLILGFMLLLLSNISLSISIPLGLFLLSKLID